MADVLRVALFVDGRSWEFEERARLDDPVSVKVDISSLLREAAHRMPLNFVSLRFLNPRETFSRSAAVSGNHMFLPAESFILSRLDAPTKLEELVMVSGLPEFDAHRILLRLLLAAGQREYGKMPFARIRKTKQSPKLSHARGRRTEVSEL